jgi:ASC-1-like (ASCH) protein
MKTENKLLIRKLIATESYNLFSEILKLDPLLEKIRIPVKFKNTNSKMLFYLRVTFNSLPSESDFKKAINRALNDTTEHYHKNKHETFGVVMIVFQKYFNTDRIGETKLIDVTKYDI